MFDIGWPELLMVAVVLILVVGPKDLPPMLRAFGRTVKKYRGMANDFKSQFNDALEESELDELRQTVTEVKKYNPLNEVTDAVKEVGAEINEAVDDAKPVKPWVPKSEEISDAARAVGEKEVKAKAATARKTAARKTTAPRKTATAAKKPSTVKPAAKDATVKAAATKTATVAKKPAAKAPAKKTTTTAAKTTRKPRAAAAKKTTAPKKTSAPKKTDAPKGKAEAK